MRKYSSVVLVAIGLLLGACATEEGTGTSAESVAGTNRPSAEAATTAEAPETPEAPPKNPKFGQTYTWENGLAVTVSTPKPFKPSEYAAAEKATAYLEWTVTIVNGTKDNYDPSLFSTTLQSANTEASEVFDMENGFEGSPSTTLLPGRESKFKIGYGVQDPKDLVLEVTPGFEYESAIFTN